MNLQEQKEWIKQGIATGVLKGKKLAQAIQNYRRNLKEDTKKRARDVFSS